MMNTLKNNRENKGQHIRRTALSVLMVLVLCVGLVAIPFESHAASKKKTVLSVSNLSSDTVVQRGGAYRINARAYRKNGSAIKGLKVKYKSSNKKIATVSKNGVIRGKKNGKVKITVRCKGKKKTYKIRVGTQVNSLSISGYHYLRKGRTNTLKAHVNGNATNKTVHWRSTNTSVATITNSGNLKATGYGTATIVAYAVDGSGTAATVTVAVPKYSGYPGGGIKWIAHRGLHTSATENTVAAFIAAGQAGGFWGCECDIWETKHETSQVSGAETENDECVSKMQISENKEDSGEMTTGAEEKSAEEDSELQEEPQVGVQAESIKAEETVDTFDLVINHDDTFACSCKVF